MPKLTLVLNYGLILMILIFMSFMRKEGFILRALLKPMKKLRTSFCQKL